MRKRISYANWNNSDFIYSLRLEVTIFVGLEFTICVLFSPERSRLNLYSLLAQRNDNDDTYFARTKL